MNAISGMLRLSIRGYRTSRGSTSGRGSRIRPPIEMTQPGMPVEDMIAEVENAEDLDQYESDFKNVAEYDRMHRRELEAQKEKLKLQITKRKYFKTEEPAMLTWGEKEQIRLLHGEDPEEWTPDRLSESFPVSKDGVLKILRGKWSPKNMEIIKRYEDNVKQNWALFKAGKLRMDPLFEAHLQKFKNRRIENTNPEMLAKTLLKPKPEFKKPQSTLFSKIIESYIDANPRSRDDVNDDDDIIPDKEDDQRHNIKSFEHIIKIDGQPQAGDQLALVTKPKKLATEKKTSGKRMTFNEFLDDHVEKRVHEDKMRPVDRVLVDELKSQVAESYKKKSLVLESASAVGTWKGVEETEQKTSSTSEDPFSELDEIAEAPTAETSKSSLWSPRKEEAKKLDVAKTSDVEKSGMDALLIDTEVASKLEGSLETGIIAREKTDAALQENYPDFIRIPRKKLKRGVTYRVEDRYYDEDGEFLYRVPVLKA